MRVVEYRHIKPKYAFCTGCGAILEFNKTDQRLTNMALHRGLVNEGKDWAITCPVCTRVIYNRDFKDTPEEC